MTDPSEMTNDELWLAIVEKLARMLKTFAEIEIPTKGHIYGLENAYDLLLEMRESAKAALKGLETEEVLLGSAGDNPPSITDPIEAKNE